MAWVEPVTDRQDGSSRMAAADMARITGNLAQLYADCQSRGITVQGGPISQTKWTTNDIISVEFWTELLGCLSNLRSAAGYTPESEPGYTMIYSNINEIERQTLAVYNMISGYDSWKNLNHWVGDPYYAGDPINAGGKYE